MLVLDGQSVEKYEKYAKGIKGSLKQCCFWFERIFFFAANYQYQAFSIHHKSTTNKFTDGPQHPPIDPCSTYTVGGL